MTPTPAQFDPEVFILQFNLLCKAAHQNAVDKGFYDDDVGPFNAGEKIALMHAELSEALEAVRHGDPPSEHIPDFVGTEEEFADVIIRIGDYVGKTGLRLGEAIVAKMAYNSTRSHRHGGKKF